MRGSARLRVASVLALAVTYGCGSTEPVVELDPVGAWSTNAEGPQQTAVELGADGSFERITATFASETCMREQGTWSLAGDRITIALEDSGGGQIGTEQFDVSLGGGTLEFVGSGGSTTFTRIPAMLSCVDYGWGEWVGEVSADIDGDPRSFADFVVDLDVDGGRLRLQAQWRPCPTCPPEATELELAIDGASGPLEPGTFTVQNDAGAERTFFGFFHPDPGNPDFEGFSTERLSPPGSFTVVEIADERISATFSFRGNPRVDGDVAPDGSTFTLVSDGVVDLRYQ